MYLALSHRVLRALGSQFLERIVEQPEPPARPPRDREKKPDPATPVRPHV